MKTFNEVKDSGNREEFGTGSVRDTREGKGRFDLIPIQALRRLARHYENGAKKYGDRNWEKGQPLSRYYDSAMRHMLAYMEGDNSEDHAAAVMWNWAAIIHHEETFVGNGIANSAIIDIGPSSVNPQIGRIAETDTLNFPNIKMPDRDDLPDWMGVPGFVYNEQCYWCRTYVPHKHVDARLKFEERYIQRDHETT